VSASGVQRHVRRRIGWLGFLLSGLFGYLAFRNVDLRELRDALASQELVFLAPAAVALAVGVLLRAWRWQLLFERATRPPFRYVLNALLVGYLFNTILPARAGELVRIQVLGRRAAISRAEVLGTVVLERAYDLLVLIGLLAVAAPFLPPVDWLTAVLVFGAALGISLALGTIVVRRHGIQAARTLARPLTLLPAIDNERVESIARNAVIGLAALRVTRLALVAIAVTAASWLALASSAWFLLLGTDIDATFGMALLVLVATNLIMVLPSSPAALGAFEAAVVLALAAYGVDRERALSFALVLHALNALPFIPLGYLALGLHTRAMSRARPA
jgi:glycosyltransferase 2 family protein